MRIWHRSLLESCPITIPALAPTIVKQSHIRVITTESGTIFAVVCEDSWAIETVQPMVCEAANPLDREIDRRFQRIYSHIPGKCLLNTPWKPDMEYRTASQEKSFDVKRCNAMCHMSIYIEN
jgi:hypothetical protein